MYCVIQKIKRKKPINNGARKELVVTTMTWGIVGQEQKTSYGFDYAGDRFERPVLDAYKISIHHSYRENGKVKKEQHVICTLGHYDLLEYSLYDYGDGAIQAAAEKFGASVDAIYKMIRKKLDLIIKNIRAEYEQTDEYKTKQQHEKIKTLYAVNKIEFEETYGRDTYKYCYDVFGVLRNEEYLEKIKADKAASEEYQRKSREHQKERFNDHFNDGSSSYSIDSRSNYNEEEKKLLHEIYRMASKKFHPDACGDDGTKMKFLTQLKDEWGL